MTGGLPCVHALRVAWICSRSWTPAGRSPRRISSSRRVVSLRGRLVSWRRTSVESSMRAIRNGIPGRRRSSPGCAESLLTRISRRLSSPRPSRQRMSASTVTVVPPSPSCRRLAVSGQSCSRPKRSPAGGALRARDSARPPVDGICSSVSPHEAGTIPAAQPQRSRVGIQCLARSMAKARDTCPRRRGFGLFVLLDGRADGPTWRSSAGS